MQLPSLLTILPLLLMTHSLPINDPPPLDTRVRDDQDGGVRTVRSVPTPTLTQGDIANIDATPLFTEPRYYYPITTLRIPLLVDIGKVVPTIPPKPEWPVPDPGPRPGDLQEVGIVIGS
ncbi:hypothetical protein I302_106064 [Kwoniella bestiolae CBS 10118]|uniref:Uncharacterized protein n=1 Tax=Kwoniella bestiolae CBS 10118 TaxID=1296100 RepID=A0A1B9G2Y3_9TREE|nr:hypothetical protein I302_05189 [Kwoniella bestiolae CBS 10118]OCF25370.1 hypothetical protein I302_05189 [Kwoniella bestiolae CBS 10118]